MAAQTTAASGEAAPHYDRAAFVAAINDPSTGSTARLAALEQLASEEPALVLGAERGRGEVNNHIHTCWSFSPYTPAMAALAARQAGLEVAGSVDHDSSGAAAEMVAACGILGMGGCAGFELRVSFAGTPFAGRKLNNPDSVGVAYMTVQGLPRTALKAATAFLEPLRVARRTRTRAMLVSLNSLLAPLGIPEIDFERDVLSLTQKTEGGGLTERHLLAAASDALIARFGRGESLIAALVEKLGLKVGGKLAEFLRDAANPHYRYDLLGLLKSSLLDRIFIQPGPDESIPAGWVIEFARSVGAIPTYAYLGDVGESPTGDKKAEKFEDEYLDELIPYLAKMGFLAIGYMPPRNTVAQLLRLQKLCQENNLLEISGVDINSSRQSFNCPEVLQPEFLHLVDSTWALVAHERLSELNADWGFFAAKSPAAGLSVAERMQRYARVGRAIDPHHPERAADFVSFLNS